MDSNYTLNCIVFGEDPGEIFLIKVASTETVHTLKEMIKDATMPTFRDVAVMYLKLWEVENMLPDDALQDNLKHHLEKKPLSPIARLQKIF
ncbi:hypothetical protein AZE42_08597 [Rhizopogon vesiculosus]|uniref:Crinkler effector protein N-terminal domain-containing protein n=1 Tax=Rhizopogon vesiculosus TaxID=180088 RepID=A0A1J8QHU7_9AGAM|nr:hypothetical protein AZE42_08597 [Rhizopogon vesiculosus]